MSVLIVSYDLDDADGDVYAALAEEIEEYEHCHLQESVYIIDTFETHKQVQAKLQPHLKKKDKLYIGSLRGSGLCIGPCESWLKSRSRNWPDSQT